MPWQLAFAATRKFDDRADDWTVELFISNFLLNSSVYHIMIFGTTSHMNFAMISWQMSMKSVAFLLYTADNEY